MGHSIFYLHPPPPMEGMIPTGPFSSEVRFRQVSFSSEVGFQQVPFTLKIDSDRVLLDIIQKNAFHRGRRGRGGGVLRTKNGMSQ